MAKVSGAAAYQQLRPSQDGLSQGAQYWGGMGMNLAQQNQRIKQRDKEFERAEKAAERKAFDEKFAKSNETLKLFDTKHKQGNEIVASAVFRLKELNARAHSVLDPQNRQNTTPQERLEAQMEIQRIQEYIPMMKIAMGGLTEHITSRNEGIAEGDFISNPEYNEFTKTFSELGEGGRVVDVAIGDDNEMYVVYKDEGSDEVPKQIPLKDLAQGKFPEPTRYVNYESSVEFGKGLVNSITEKTSDGFDLVTKTGINEESEAMLEANANAFYNVDENGRPTAELVGFLFDRGVDAYSLNPEKLEEFAAGLREKYIRDVKSSVKQEDSRVRNHGAAIQASRLAMDRDKQDKPDGPGIGFNVDAQTGNIVEREITDADGKKHTAYSLKNENKGLPFVLEKTKYSETRTDNIYITSDGQIYGDVYKVEVTTTFDPNNPMDESKEVISSPENRWLTKEEANKIATERGYKNAREMYLSLDEERKQYGNQTSVSNQPEVDEFGVPIQ